MYDGKYAEAYREWTGMTGTPVSVTSYVDSQEIPSVRSQCASSLHSWRICATSSTISSIICTGDISCGTSPAGRMISRATERLPTATGFQAYHLSIMPVLATSRFCPKPRQWQQRPQCILHAPAAAGHNRPPVAGVYITARYRTILGDILPVLHDRYRYLVKYISIRSPTSPVSATTRLPVHSTHSLYG